jgi:hypothetical protein
MNKIDDIIRRHWKGDDYKETKLSKTVFKFGSEAWVVKKRDEQRLEAAQIKFLRHLLGITKLDRKRNQSIMEKLGVRNTVLEIQQYQRKWLQHPQRMDISRLPRQAPKYEPKARRSIRRLKERWKD